MPRGNPAVWKHYGASYAQLSSQAAGPGPGSIGMSMSMQAQGLGAAGTPSTQPPRGAGSFVAQTSWSLGASPGAQGQQLPAPKATESKMQYKPPPQESYQRRAPLRRDHGEFPVPNYPHDFKTLKQADFPGTGLTAPGFQRAQPVKQRDSGRILPDDVPPQFTTQARADYAAPRRDDGQALKLSRAGMPATQKPGYNIITGGQTLANNVFEGFDGRDYRRHR